MSSVTTEVENYIPLQVILCQINIKFCCQLTQNVTTDLILSDGRTLLGNSIKFFFFFEFQTFFKLTKSVVVFWVNW